MRYHQLRNKLPYCDVDDFSTKNEVTIIILILRLARVVIYTIGSKMVLLNIGRNPSKKYERNPAQQYNYPLSWYKLALILC